MDRVSAPATPARAWRPRRVLITRAARDHAHGRTIADRAAALGIPVTELSGNQLRLGSSEDERRAYAEAKSTFAVAVAPPSKLRLQPIAPSADWRVDLAEGCPAHCAYCYLAGSLKGPPITRVYANLDEITATLPAYLGQGTITSRSRTRAHEGTTFEASCYTDPLALEPLTGSLGEMIRFFGAWDADVQLRFTSKFADVSSLLDLPHGGRTRMRASINPPAYHRFEGGTDRVAARLDALRQMALAGYKVGLTVAPIIAAEGWREAYADLIAAAAAALRGIPGLDLTAELITHRFTPGSRAVLTSWYPGSDLEMDPALRAEKRTKFAGTKFVYPPELMKELKSFFYEQLAARLPEARILYWT
ncbi:SPL family radical SAM protein [Sphingomonas glaciei]|uniref:Radical SAM protein n=1 Tax=Sphingomonas glaciei TaxID=2938948 RepID=A0ABY5MX00_9SPHN|nr:radical SAM protein [Sphingomonas glaciei]UUR06901.1 radical SAM protein [Sphingomonas glaciei]